MCNALILGRDALNGWRIGLPLNFPWQSTSVKNEIRIYRTVRAARCAAERRWTAGTIQIIYIECTLNPGTIQQS